MRAVIETVIRAVCPTCQVGGWAICHPPGRYGPWGCDICGARFTFDIGQEGIELIQEPTPDTPAWLIVKLASSEPPVYFVVDHPIYAHAKDETPEERARHERYYVEEHTCPTNLVPVAAIVSEGDPDPHGILEFIAHVPKDEWGREQPEEGWSALIERVMLSAEWPG
ncbi:MAG TPA: hypothetical protein VFW19_10525 [Allosphingosinicella sp.]|nr:hypothetical protein [Allosphingosinicella sp.]